MRIILTLLISLLLTGNTLSAGKLPVLPAQKTDPAVSSLAVNHPPDKPVLIAPPDGSTVRLPVIVEWQCSDPDGDVLTYTVEITVRQNGVVVFHRIIDTGTESRFDSRDHYFPEEGYGKPIEWQVTASDGELETKGDIWTITVSGMNHPPEFTGSPVPADHSVLSPGTVDFSWNCQDDDDDDLYYTFCSRETGSPWNCSQELVNPTYSLNLSDDDTGNTYEWKVRADDTYEVTESPVWSFSVCTPIHEVEHVTICANETYLGWSETGIYTRTFKAANGCDSIITTHLTVESNYEIVEEVFICEGEEYRGWSETWTYQWSIPSDTGCDTLVTTYLTVLPTDSVTEEVFICEGESYKGHTTTGSFTETLVSRYGCDSIVTTNLTVIPPSETTEHISICEGDNFKGYTEAGTYTDTLVSSLGCDSIVTTIVSVAESVETTAFIVICEGESWKGWTTDGIYKDTLTTIEGCDSIVTTILTVVAPSETTEHISICEGDTYKGYTEAGTYIDTLVSSLGCDSIVTTILSVIENVEITESIVVCEGESWKGWTTEGQYKDTLTAANGCDSIVTTLLTVHPVYHETEEVEIYNGDSYKGWTTSGQYTDTLISVHGCDSIITTHLIVLNNPPDKPTLIFPSNNATVMQPFDIQWEGSDPDGDTLTYTVRIRPQGDEL
jgi:hypothetical protein